MILSFEREEARVRQCASGFLSVAVWLVICITGVEQTRQLNPGRRLLQAGPGALAQGDHGLEVNSLQALPEGAGERARQSLYLLRDRLCTLLYAAALMREAAFAKATGREDAADTLLLARHFWDRRLGGDPGPESPGYLERLEAICERC